MSQAESLRLEFIERTFHWRNDPRIYKWCRQNDSLSWPEHKAWWEKERSDTKMFGFFVEGTPAGMTGLTSIDWVNRRAEVSLYIDPEKHRQGLGYLAATQLIDRAFNVYNLNLIWGEAFEGSPAIGLFRKCGFTEEGRRRQFYFREGKYVDAILFSLTRSDTAKRDADKDFQAWQADVRASLERLETEREAKDRPLRKAINAEGAEGE